MQASAAAPATAATPSWRPFSQLSAAEAAFVHQRWRCSDAARVMVTCVPGKTSFAIVGPERNGPDAEMFHWSVFSLSGQHLDTGWEIALESAQRVAREVQQLWSHRCALRHSCRCAAAG